MPGLQSNFRKDDTFSIEVRVETVDVMIDQLLATRTQNRLPVYIPIPIIGRFRKFRLYLSFGKPPQAMADIRLKIRKAWLSIANFELQRMEWVSELYAYTQPQFCCAA